MERVPGSVVPPKVVTPSMLVTWWTAQIQETPAVYTARLEFLFPPHRHKAFDSLCDK